MQNQESALCDAFHHVIVGYIAWIREINSQAAATCMSGPCCGRHAPCPRDCCNLAIEYDEEPCVVYNGQPLPISTICKLAEELTGDLPPFIADLIQFVVVGGLYRDMTYPSAV